MTTIDWALYTEKAVGRGSPTFADVVNRPLREVLTISGADPDASFVGFSLVGHTHAATDIVSGTLPATRGGTGVSSPTAGGLLVAAGALAMTVLAAPAAGQVVRSTGSAWAASAIVAADISDLATATTGITKLGAVSVGVWNGTAIVDTYLATIATAGKVANSATTATSANTASAIVARDGSGNFAAGTITASFTGALTGNASTASALATPRAINGVSFDGTAAITVPAAANTLTGTVLAANVVTSSLTGVGTIATGVWNGSVIPALYGGTGVANTNTITLGGNIVTASSLTHAGAFATTITATGVTNVTLPTSGTLATTAGNVATATALATARTIAITGDLAYTSPTFDGSGNVTAVGTLATVNSNVGAFGGSTAIPVVTVNAKGLVTAVSTAAVVAPAGTLSGATLAANVLASSLTSVGVLASPHMTAPVIDSGGLTISAGGQNVTGTSALQAVTATSATVVGPVNFGTDDRLFTGSATTTVYSLANIANSHYLAIANDNGAGSFAIALVVVNATGGISSIVNLASSGLTWVASGFNLQITNSGASMNGRSSLIRIR